MKDGILWNLTMEHGGYDIKNGDLKWFHEGTWDLRNHTLGLNHQKKCIVIYCDVSSKQGVKQRTLGLYYTNLVDCIKYWDCINQCSLLYQTMVEFMNQTDQRCAEI